MSDWPTGTTFGIVIYDSVRRSVKKKDLDHCLKKVLRDADNFAEANGGDALVGYCTTSSGFKIVLLIALKQIDDDGTIPVHVGFPSDFGQSN